MKSYSLKNMHTVVVHDGIFHQDDVNTVATCQLGRELNHLSPLKVIRTSIILPEWKLENGVVVADVGGGILDHHESEEQKERREDGTPFAAFGKTVRLFQKDLYLDGDTYKILDEGYIKALDDHDNNFCGNQLALMTRCYNKQWYEDISEEEIMERFNFRVMVAKEDLKVKIKWAKSVADVKRIALELLSTNKGSKIIWMDRYVPIGSIQEIKDDPDLLFIGSPSDRGGYQVCSVRRENIVDGKKISYSKLLFPEVYRGRKNIDEIGMTFCHSAGFLACFKTMEDAMKFMIPWLKSVNI